MSQPIFTQRPIFTGKPVFTQALKIWLQKVDDLLEAVEKQEQYSRLNCLLLHGIPKKKEENIDKLSIKAINEHLVLDINDRDIYKIHRIGNAINAGEKPTPIIIKPVRYNDWKMIFDSKKKLGNEDYKHRKFEGYTYEKVECGKGKVAEIW